MIHPTAVIEDGVQLGENVKVFTESSDSGIIIRGRNENTVCFEFEGMYR